MAQATRIAAPAYDRDIDVRGLTCPLPALRARVALRGMAAGEVLRIRATDREAPRDFERFAHATGHDLIAQRTVRREFVFYLRKKGL